MQDQIQEHIEAAKAAGLDGTAELINMLWQSANKLRKDANRYRFLRIEDNWGEDSGDDCFELLAEASGDEFDRIVDSRMNKRTPVTKK